jgi:hypothetical protein
MLVVAVVVHIKVVQLALAVRVAVEQVHQLLVVLQMRNQAQPQRVAEVEAAVLLVVLQME